MAASCAAWETHTETLHLWAGDRQGCSSLVAGCSSHEPKPMAQPTPDQVRGHADHTFDKLKQEERERASQEPR